eukprot:TRINITY_DN4854_c0_g1_i1.p2 TRINITY_DN4854_c0_g1~~TRINITY_DN4854_c0_g1_i1.p2  ORF type:complete len:177 (+),score=6.16 TRINITY_DN4854_c0_g1_i1:538-1068(+)
MLYRLILAVLIFFSNDAKIRFSNQKFIGLFAVFQQISKNFFPSNTICYSQKNLNKYTTLVLKGTEGYLCEIYVHKRKKSGDYFSDNPPLVDNQQHFKSPHPRFLQKKKLSKSITLFLLGGQIGVHTKRSTQIKGPTSSKKWTKNQKKQHYYSIFQSKSIYDIVYFGRKRRKFFGIF